MPNQYTALAKPIGELLSLTSPPIVVPDFQRNFAWETSDVETFWLDLLAFSSRYPAGTINDQEYFLGSVVIVNEGASHLLLDGQQRLATATILLSVIRDFLKEYNTDAAARTSHRFIVDVDDASGNLTYKLTLNDYDRDFFRREVQDEPDGAGGPEAEIQSHRLMRKARELLARKFDEKYGELGRGRAAFDWALRI